MKLKFISNNWYYVTEEYNRAYKRGYVPTVNVKKESQVFELIKKLSQELKYKKGTRLRLGTFIANKGEFKIFKFTVGF